MTVDTVDTDTPIAQFSKVDSGGASIDLLGYTAVHGTVDIQENLGADVAQGFVLRDPAQTVYVSFSSAMDEDNPGSYKHTISLDGQPVMTSVLVDGTTITGDGVTTPLTATGGGGGVVTDSTLTGDGTIDDPLHVVGGGGGQVYHDDSLDGTGADDEHKLSVSLAQTLGLLLIEDPTHAVIANFYATQSQGRLIHKAQITAELNVDGPITMGAGNTLTVNNQGITEWSQLAQYIPGPSLPYISCSAGPPTLTTISSNKLEIHGNTLFKVPSPSQLPETFFYDIVMGWAAGTLNGTSYFDLRAPLPGADLHWSALTIETDLDTGVGSMSLGFDTQVDGKLTVTSDLKVNNNITMSSYKYLRFDDGGNTLSLSYSNGLLRAFVPQSEYAFAWLGRDNRNIEPDKWYATIALEDISDHSFYSIKYGSRRFFIQDSVTDAPVYEVSTLGEVLIPPQHTFTGDLHVTGGVYAVDGFHVWTDPPGRASYSKAEVDQMLLDLRASIMAEVAAAYALKD
jgi:hypothetical protein